MSLSEYVVISPVTDKVMINLKQLHLCEGFELNRLESFVPLIDDGKSYRDLNGELFVTCKVFAEICKRCRDRRLSEVRDNILSWFDVDNFNHIDDVITLNRHMWDCISWVFRMHAKYLMYFKLEANSADFVDQFKDLTGGELKDTYEKIHGISPFVSDYILRKDVIK